MNIVVNAIPLLSKMTGIGNCIYNLSKHLLKMDHENEYSFYYGYFSKRLQSSREPGDDIRELKFNILKKSKPYIKKFSFLSEALKKFLEEFNRHKSTGRKIDLYYEPNYIPTGIQARSLVTTVHDFSFHLYPEWHPKDRIQYFKKYFYSRIGRSDLITADSEFVRHQAHEILDYPEKQIIVVPMGYESMLFKPNPPEEVEAFRQLRQLPSRFILFVGSIEPRKNIQRLLLAYQRLPEHLRQEYKLVLAGFSGWENKAIMELISSMKEQVVFLGYLNVQELALAYNAATVFAYPSLYEGFGLPPLEAMACRTPVLVSNVTSLPEICGTAAAYCNPLDTEDIAWHLQTLLEDSQLRERLTAAGEEHVRKYTWENAAQQMIEVFRAAGI